LPIDYHNNINDVSTNHTMTGITILIVIGCVWAFRPRKPTVEYKYITQNVGSADIPTLTMIIGPMFAGKTGEVIRRINRFKYQQKRCLIIKHSFDTRFNPYHNKHALQLTTHDYTSFSISDSQDLFDLRYCNCLDEIDSLTMTKFDCIVLEEAHMFGNKWWGFVQNCLLQAKKSIIVSTIDSYAPTEPGQLPHPIPDLSQSLIWAQKIIKFCSVCCLCRQPNAVFSIRKTANKDLIDVGGADKYQPYCVQCFTNNHK